MGYYYARHSVMLVSYYVYIYINEHTEKSYTRYAMTNILYQAGYIWALRKGLYVFMSFLPCYYSEPAFERILYKRVVIE